VVIWLPARAVDAPDESRGPVLETEPVGAMSATVGELAVVAVERE
jgi:hypothetical protein